MVRKKVAITSQSDVVDHPVTRALYMVSFPHLFSHTFFFSPCFASEMRTVGAIEQHHGVGLRYKSLFLSFEKLKTNIEEHVNAS